MGRHTSAYGGWPEKRLQSAYLQFMLRTLRALANQRLSKYQQIDTLRHLAKPEFHVANVGRKVSGLVNRQQVFQPIDQHVEENDLYRV